MADASVEAGTSDFEVALAGGDAAASEPTSTPPVDAGAAGTEGTETAVESEPDLAALLEQQMAEEFGGGGQAETQARLSKEEELQKLLAGVQEGTPAHERIRSLANARSELAAKMAQYETERSQIEQYIQGVQQQARGEVERLNKAHEAEVGTLRQQMQALTAQFETLKSFAPKPPPNPGDELRESWMSKLSERDKQMREQWEKEHLSPLQSRLEAIETERKREADARLADTYREGARTAAENIALRGLEMPAEVKDRLVKSIGAQIIARQMHTGCTPEQAAQEVRREQMMAAAAFTRATSKSFAASRKAGQGAPTATSTRRSTGNGTPVPTLDEAQKAGYTDELEFLAAQDGA